MAAYLAIIRKADGTDFWADIPDIPGCVSRGATADEAVANLRQALALHLEEGGNLVKPPRRAEQLAKEELDDAVETVIIEL